MKKSILFAMVWVIFASQITVANDKITSDPRKNQPENYAIKTLDAHADVTWKTIDKWYPTPQYIKDDRGKAKAAFGAIEKNEAWVDTFSNEDIHKLPVGVKYVRENLTYAIGITQAEIYKDYTAITVFAKVELPQTREDGKPVELLFGANNVKLSHDGGIVGDANLVLLGDVYLPFNGGKWMLSLKGGFDYKTGNTLDLTYVTIDCSGVKELSIQGEVEFSRNLILPVEPGGEVNESRTHVSKQIQSMQGTTTVQVPNRVKGAFSTVLTNWNDLLVGISLQPFVLAKKRNNTNYDSNFQFYVNEAVLDFSDLRNFPQVVFPNHYHEEGLLVPDERLWRGVYINTLEVRLPKEFKTSKTISQGNQRVSFGAHHLLVDGYGVSGSFYAENIFPLESGRTNKENSWAYSLDRMEISLAANRLVKASFNGRILLPISQQNGSNNDKEQLGLSYQGIISEEEYLLNVSNESVIDFNLWKAKGELLPNSSIEFRVEDGTFKPKATLHGTLAISVDQPKGGTSAKKSGKSLVEFKQITFQNLVLQTESPVFSVDYMGYRDKVSVAGFPASIENIGVTINETSANLYTDVAINLMGENNGFAANTSIAVLGEFKEDRYLQTWNYKRLEIDAIALKADLGAFSMEGMLTILNDDPEYGDGFAADLRAKFKAFGDIEVGARGIFGKTTFRYWQFEAKVDNLPPGLGTGAINLDGFAGGASYRMRRAGFSSSFSPTGIGYTPDNDVGLGVKAMVMLNVVNRNVFKGGAGFEIVFNRRGGVDFLGFYGQGTLMGVSLPGMDNISSVLSKVKENTTARKKFMGVTNNNLAKSWVGRNLLNKASTDFPQMPMDKAAISAKLAITFDFRNNVLHGELDTYLNVVGGLIKGRGAGGRAGWAVLHFSPKDWYIYLGTPEDRLGIRIGVGPVSVTTGGYFMVGTKLPGSPPPPPVVAEILGTDASELDYMRDENALSSGGGFAFGADISVDTGDLRFLIFYARFQAGAGFDIMLRNYGKARCSNTGDQVGINGWYANGQAYVYLQGELGIHVKLFFINKKIPIIKAGAAVLLQVKAPNPVWMRGYVGGHFSVLGGLVSGRFRFKLTIGKECIFEDASPLGGLKIITDLRPNDGGKNIDVFTIPQATFSMKVGEPIVIPGDSGDKHYKIVLEKFRILHKGKEIEGKLEWGTEKDRANFVSSDILPPREQFTVEVEVSFKEQVNGVYKQVVVNGKKAVEVERRTFTTGDAPTYIPLHNITYAYPVIGQKYFLEKEYSKGYIQLRRGQDYLFDNTKWKSYLTYSKDEQVTAKTDFQYHTAKNTIGYTLPNVSQATAYQINIVSTPKGGGSVGGGDTNYKSVQLGKQAGNDNRVKMKKTQAQNISKDGVIERLAYDFTTSKYTTLRQKINSIRTEVYGWWPLFSDILELENKIHDHEPFGLADINGTAHTDNTPLIKAAATLEDTYFRKDINPPLYAKYPIGGYRFTNRDDKVLGAPPRYAVSIISSYIDNLTNEVNEHDLRTVFPYRYDLGLTYKRDWVDMHEQIVNDHIKGLIPSNSPVLKFLDERFPLMRYGVYKIRLTYILPGGVSRGTNATYKYKNPNKFRL